MRFRNLLIVSLLVNLCLLALVVFRLTESRIKDAPAFRQEPRKFAPANPAIPLPKTQHDWAAIKSPDWKQYARNLRDAGCPEETMRDILFAEINKSYAARWRSLNGDDGKNYWVSKRDGWWGHT